MKLLFVTDNGFSSKNGEFYYSGANVQHYSTVTSFFNEIIFIARNSKFESSSSKISSKYKTYLVDSITSGRRFIKNYVDLNKILEKEIKEADIVMCFGLNGYLAYKKAKKYGKPVIAYVGGCVYDILINMDSSFKRKTAPILMTLIKDMVRNADYVHYVDEYLLEKYPTKGEYLICPSARIEVSHNILEKRINKIETKDSKTILGIIGYTHNKIKGIDTAIKSLPFLGENYILQVVGRGDHTWLDKIANELGVVNQVEFLGVLNGRERIFDWLDSIDVYLQPSLTEGMPRATLEAMSRACPVVSTSVGGLKTIVDEEYRIATGDFVKLADVVKSLSDKETLKENVKWNYEVAKKFDYHVLDFKRNSFYGEIAKNVSVQKNE